jgi:hypothetical protein
MDARIVVNDERSIRRSGAHGKHLALTPYRRLSRMAGIRARLRFKLARAMVCSPSD